jgi:hypothetical protein
MTTRRVLDNPKSRSAATPREYSGDVEGQYLAKVLNNLEDRSNRRVFKLFKLMKQLAEYLESHNVVFREYEGPPEVQEMQKGINELLEQYPCFPWIHVDGKGFCETSSLPCGRQSMGEQLRVEAVIELGQKRLLSRMRQCQQCAKWFYARFSHQGSCSAKCRQSHYKTSKAFREKRREYMRQYYRLQRSGKVK